MALHRFAPAQGGGEGDDRAAALILWVKPGGGRDGVCQAVPVQVGIFILQHHLVLLDLQLLLRRGGEVRQGAAGPGIGGLSLLHLARYQIAAKIHTENISARNSTGGRFLGPDIMLRIRSSVSLADPDRGVEKGVRGNWFIHG